VLCLKRRIGERIILSIGGVEAVVTVLDIGRGQVRLGIVAPLTVTVWRESKEELFVRPGDYERAKRKPTAATENTAEKEAGGDLEWLDSEPSDSGPASSG
jgi:carbon storage regulator CsrA